MADLTYFNDSMFTRFISHTDAGDKAWNEMAAECDGVAAVFNHQAKAVIAQLRRAGYEVKKSPKQKPLTAAELDTLLEELA